MKKNNKQRLFEVMSRIDKTFNPQIRYGSDLTLEEAQRTYGRLVSWVLDNNDLRIINRVRNEWTNEKDEIRKNTYNTQMEDKLSKLWDKHMLRIKDLLWKNAQSKI